MRAGSIVTLAVLAFLLAATIAFVYFGLSEAAPPMVALQERFGTAPVGNLSNQWSSG